MAAYTVVPRRGKGQGMQANRAINRGEEIVREAPLIKLAIGLDELFHAETFWDRDEARSGIQAIERAVASLNPEARVLLDTLHNAHPEEGATVGIVRSNVWTEDVETNGQTYKEMMVFNDISRVNHSCRPNAEHHWNAETRTGSLHALRQIGGKEEIFVDYLGYQDSLSERNERRRQLKDAWGFNCACEACVLTARRGLTDDNNLRREAGGFYVTLDAPLVPSPNPRARDRQWMDKLEEAWGYIERLRQLKMYDGRLAWGYTKLAAIHNELYDIAAAGGPHSPTCACHESDDGATWHLRRALEAMTDMCGLDMITHGPTHPRVQQDFAEMRELTERICAARQ